MAIDVDDFIATMTRWRDFFLDGADMPVIGVGEETLRRLTLPTCIIPGYDMIHPREVGEALARILPHSELHRLPPQERPEGDEARMRARLAHQQRLADVFLEFLAKHFPRDA
jgi:pimeloyl-ACP methyl ester carboxylesterase